MLIFGTMNFGVALFWFWLGQAFSAMDQMSAANLWWMTESQGQLLGVVGLDSAELLTEGLWEQTRSNNSSWRSLPFSIMYCILACTLLTYLFFPLPFSSMPLLTLFSFFSSSVSHFNFFLHFPVLSSSCQGLLFPTLLTLLAAFWLLF